MGTRQTLETSSPPAFFSFFSPQQDDAKVESLLLREDVAAHLDSLPDAASRAGLLPLLAWRLMERAPVSEILRNQLRDTFHRNNLRNLIRVGELIGLCKELDSEGVRSLMIKGPILASLCYGNLGLRQFDDLDVLVHPEDVCTATQIIRDRGYRFWLPEWEQKDLARFFARPDYLRFLWWDQIMLTRSDPKTTLELHWAALPGYFAFEMPFGRLWESHQTHSLSGYTFRTLSDADTVLLIVSHGSKHVWSSAKWICDLAWAVAKFPDLDWFSLEEEAEKQGGVRMLRVASLLARGLFSAPLSAEWTEHIERDARARSIASRIQFDLVASISRGTSYRETTVARLSLREKNRDRIRYLVRSLFTPSSRDWRWLPLPSALFPLYRIIRPVRLVCRWALDVLSRSNGQPEQGQSAEAGDMGHHRSPDLVK